MEEPIFLDTFQGRLRLEGVLETRTGLHIGAGGSGDPLATDSPVVRNAAGLPYIPGSSVKGVIRSAAEGLFPRIPAKEKNKPKLWTCNFLAGDPCVHHTVIQELRESHKKELQNQYKSEELEYEVQRAMTTEVWLKSCTICRLFGSLALASRVRFPDLPLEGDLPMMEIRNGVGIDRDRELAASGVLYDFEAVPPGTMFEMSVILDNYCEAEAGLILWLFDQLKQGHLALGGKTSRGLGQVRIEWKNIHETRLHRPDGTAKSNPFSNLLSTEDLLHPEKAKEDEPSEPEIQLPTTGDTKVWKALADLLQDMPQIDKTTLGQKAGEIKILKAELNDKLDLGLAGKRAQQKAWDTVLSRFVECRFLVAKGGNYVLASLEAAQKGEEAPGNQRSAELQKTYDRFVAAMARLWEEN